MKFLLLLLSIVLFISGRDVLPSPFMKRIASMRSDYLAENRYSGPPITEKERQEYDLRNRIAASCIYVYCHYEDRNECRKECTNLAKQWNPENIRADTPYFEDCNLLEINNEKSCVNDCVKSSFKTDQTGKVCSALCATLFSYTEKERVRYRKESEFYCFYVPVYFWLPWV